MIFFAIGSAFVADGDDRGFIWEHDALPRIDQRIGGTEVDRHIPLEK